jgi:hypothetical protein
MAWCYRMDFDRTMPCSRLATHENLTTGGRICTGGAPGPPIARLDGYAWQATRLASTRRRPRERQATDLPSGDAIATLFLYPVQAAELQADTSPRLRLGHACAQVVRDLTLDVVAQFGIQLRGNTRSAE